MTLLWKPNDGSQTAYLASTAREVMFGGAVGGGKSDAIVAMALRWADHPKHRAIILRRTRPQLQEVIDRTQSLYPDIVPGAQWKESESRWRFPSGAVIQMGHAENETDIHQYKSFEYNLVCFDELTSFTEYQYKFMFLRNRTKSADLPLWIRSATNPGDVGHQWVFERFIENRAPYKVYAESQEFQGRQLVTTRQFIPSFVWDNKALPNPDEYIAGILQMPAEDISAFVYGQWSQLSGTMFKRGLVADVEPRLLDPSDYYVVRGIDYGTGDPTCVLWGVHYPRLNVVDIVAELYVKDTALDGIVAYIKQFEQRLRLPAPIESKGSPEMVNRQATSGGQSIASMMTTQGVFVEQGSKDRVGGWARIGQLAERGALRVWRGAAPNLLRTLPKLQRDPKKPQDTRLRQEDHAPDALRYLVMAIYDRPQVVQQTERPTANRDRKFEQLMEQLRKSKSTTEIPQLGAWPI